MIKKNYTRTLRRYVQFYMYSFKIRIRTLDSSKIRIFILCFFISFFIWLFQYFNAEHTTTLNFPISIKPTFTLAGLIYIEKPPETIKVNVTGTGWSLLKYLFLPSPPLIFNSENPLRQTNFRTKQLLPQFSTLYNDIIINSIIEDTVHFKYDTLSQKRITVFIDSNSIELSKNHRIVSNIYYTPQTFMLKAPSTYIKTYSDTHFIQINQPNLQDDFQNDFEIDYLKNKAFSTIDRDRVYVNFKVESFEVHIRHLILKLKYFPKSVSLDSSNLPDQIEYLFPRGKFKGNTIDSVKVILDYRQRDKTKRQICPLIPGLDTLREAKLKSRCFDLIYHKAKK